MKLKRGLTFVIMSLLAVVMLYPFVFMINTSFKSKEQFLGAAGHSIASWQKILTVMPVGRQLLNSTIVCVGAITIILAVSSLAGFALS